MSELTLKTNSELMNDFFDIVFSTKDSKEEIRIISLF